MDIVEGASYEAKDLISFRKVMTAPEMRQMIYKLREYILVNGAQKSGQLITATYGIEGTKSDTEVFIPINKEIPSSDEFTFLPNFKIVNRAKIKHKGLPSWVPATYLMLKERMESQGYTFKPPFYHVYIVEANEPGELELFEIDIYVSCTKFYNKCARYPTVFFN